MNYLDHMRRVLLLDAGIYRRIAGTPLAMRYCMINVTLLGVIYGLSSVRFAGYLLAGQPDPSASFNSLTVLLVGTSVAFILHGGLALFIWVFCRGIGGCPQFLPPYLNIGIAAIGLWPLAPAAAALQVGLGGMPLQAVSLVAALYGAVVIFVAVRAASGLTNLKMSLAALATIVYIACFLYLWV